MLILTRWILFYYFLFPRSFQSLAITQAAGCRLQLGTEWHHSSLTLWRRENSHITHTLQTFLIVAIHHSGHLVYFYFKHIMWLFQCNVKIELWTFTGNISCLLSAVFFCPFWHIRFIKCVRVSAYKLVLTQHSAVLPVWSITWIQQQLCLSGHRVLGDISCDWSTPHVDLKLGNLLPDQRSGLDIVYFPWYLPKCTTLWIQHY